jgi:hypothetical protein
LDGQEKQLPIIMGTFAKIPKGKKENNEVPPLARATNNVKKDPVGPEPKSSYEAQYPWNRAFVSRSGHVFEVDDTPAKERLHVYHKSGSYFEINKDGQLIAKVVGDNYSITVKDNTVYVGGNVSIEVKGNADISVDGNVTATANSWSITGDVSLDGKLTATGDVVANSISLINHVHHQTNGTYTDPPKK